MMSTATLVLLAPLLLCAQSPPTPSALASASTLLESGFADESIKWSLPYRRSKARSVYFKSATRMYEWCQKDNKTRPTAARVRSKVQASGTELLNALTQEATIRLVLLSYRNAPEVIGSWAQELQYSCLEILRDSFEDIELPKIENYFRSHRHTAAAGVKRIVYENCKDDKLTQIRNRIRHEMKQVLNTPTDEYLRSRSPACTHTDAIFFLLRKEELPGADFYKELSTCFATLLEDESQHTTESGFLAPLFALALKLQGFGIDHAVRCKKALLSRIVAIKDRSVTKLLSWDELSAEPTLYVLDFIEANNDRNISPYFLSHFMDWFWERRIACDMTLRRIRRMVRNYYFANAIDPLRLERLKVLSADSALLSNMPMFLLCEMRDILRNSTDAGVEMSSEGYKLFMDMLENHNRPVENAS